MNSEQQYIDFFQENKEKISANCSSQLNAYREAAFEAFQRLGFPAYQSEDFRHTNIPELLSPDFGFYLDNSKRDADLFKRFRCNVSNLFPHTHFILNGHFHKGEGQHPLPSGVFSGSLNTFAQQYPEVFAQYYNQQASKKEDGLTAFNTLLLQDGYVLYVPQNVVVENPVQITNISNGAINSLANRRMLIILEKGAQAKIMVCDHTNSGNTQFANVQVNEIYVGKNAALDYYDLEESTPETTRLSSCFVQQAANSNVVINNITLSNGTTRNSYIVDLEGENAEIHLLGMAIADKKEKIDNYTAINHKVPHCRSNELFKYVLEGESVGAFSGRIVVSPDAQKTEAYQNNRNLCVGNNCRMFSKPQLEIYADDVKCSHGMTTGQLDDNALFYMRSRGIPENEARYLLKLAFTMDVLDGIRLDGLQDRLKLLVEKRFRGELVKCRGCI